jgi:hypothetical protein
LLASPSSTVTPPSAFTVGSALTASSRGSRIATPTAAEVQNEYLTQRLAKMLIEAGLRLENDQRTRKQIISGLDEISSTNECGQLAVQQAVFELQKPAEVNDDEDLMPISAPWVLNLIQYTFDEQEGFIETVGQIETDMTSVETEQD